MVVVSESRPGGTNLRAENRYSFDVRRRTDGSRYLTITCRTPVGNTTRLSVEEQDWDQFRAMLTDVVESDDTGARVGVRLL